MLLLRLSGWFLLRLATRQFSALLLKAPPRSTRDASQVTPQTEVCGDEYRADGACSAKKSRAASRRVTEQPASRSATSGAVIRYSMGDEQHKRNPMRLKREPGSKR